MKNRFNYRRIHEEYLTEEQINAYMDMLYLFPRYEWSELFGETDTNDFYDAAMMVDSKVVIANEALESVGLPELHFAPINPEDCFDDYYFNDFEIFDTKYNKIYPAGIDSDTDEWLEKRDAAERINGEIADKIYDAVEAWIEAVDDFALRDD